jgi:uncharacterized protein (TIGR00369 family)
MTQTQLTSLDSGDVARTRTYSWADPSATLAALPGLPGVEALAAIGRGELPRPPVLEMMGIEPVDVGEGWITFALEPHEMHYNPLGSVHGGVIATLLDSAAGCAVHSILPAGTGYTSLDLTVKYLRPVTATTGRILATGTVLSRGSRTALAEAKLTDKRDRLMAHATSSCMIFDLPG